MYPKFIIGLLFCCTATMLSAQTGVGQNIGKWDSQIYISDVNGRPVNNRYTDVNGYPFVFEHFKLGTIELKNGRKFAEVPLKLDIVAHEVLFTSSNREEGIISSDFVLQVSVKDTTPAQIDTCLYRTGFPPIDNYKSREFCQVLADGKLTLLKTMRKAVDTRKNDLSGEIYKEFALYEDFYVYQNGEMKRLKKDKAFLLMLMHDKRDEMVKYLKQDKKNIKNPQILAETFKYYNGL
ncbi:MAG TPA: hypothetical protein VJ552_02030 [Sediminibacterium sp.]|nr:hypothetical protein [Sediminibacterium sp.]